MKAISLWQPWASLWAHPAWPKPWETRHWSTNVRGWVLVHAAKRPNPMSDPEVSGNLDRIASVAFGATTWRARLPYGALIGAVNIDQCVRCETIRDALRPEILETGNFADGRFAWHRAEAALFEQPTAYRGRQGFFDVPIDLTLPAAALNQLYHAGALAHG